MAAVDPIVYAQLCKLFPKLTQIQVTDACLYSAGATYKEIGELRGVSPETIKKSLEAAQKRLDITNLPTLRMVFLSRVILCSRSAQRNSDNSSPKAVSSTLLELDLFFPLVPELSLPQATYVFHYVSGLTFDLIADLLDASVDEIRKTLDSVLSKLQIPSLSSLRVFVLSKLLMSLTLVSAQETKH